MSDVDDDHPILNELSICTLKGEWSKVIHIYKNYPSVHTEKIPRSEETALHIAVSVREEEIVSELVRIISEGPSKMKALEVKDKRGNTPLHIAAAVGSEFMCYSIAREHKNLVLARNNEGENPFFLAALRGHIDAFILLHFFLIPIDGKKRLRPSQSRRDDGNTFLHCAIVEEHFDMAFLITKIYEDLVFSINERGMSPLHLLATNPSAFGSGTYLGYFSRIIYHFMFIDARPPYELWLDEDYEKANNYPENYETCCNFISFLKEMTKVVTGRGRDERQRDIEKSEFRSYQDYPGNWKTCFDFMWYLFVAIQVIFGLGLANLRKIREQKQKNAIVLRILDEFLTHVSQCKYDNDGRKPIGAPRPEFDMALDGPDLPILSEHHIQMEGTNDESSRNEKGKKENFLQIEKDETPLLTASRNGISEMVQRILKIFPQAIYDNNSEKKNAVLLAVENKRLNVYQLLSEMITIKDHVFSQVDKERNSALHLAAMSGGDKQENAPLPALQMQSELKFYEKINDSLPFHFVAGRNKKDQTPAEIFTDTHKELLKAGRDWYVKTSKSCSVVATLIATVAFATSATIPGGIKEESGRPNLDNQPAFMIFAVSSLIALCLSVTSVIMFLSILTSRFQETDFRENLPRKLFIGMTSFFLSMASMLVSFCAGHFFILQSKLKLFALSVYAMVCLPVAFALADFPVYSEIVKAIKIT